MAQILGIESTLSEKSALIVPERKRLRKSRHQKVRDSNRF